MTAQDGLENSARLKGGETCKPDNGTAQEIHTLFERKKQDGIYPGHMETNITWIFFFFPMKAALGY